MPHKPLHYERKIVHGRWVDINPDTGLPLSKKEKGERFRKHVYKIYDKVIKTPLGTWKAPFRRSNLMPSEDRRNMLKLSDVDPALYGSDKKYFTVYEAEQAMEADQKAVQKAQKNYHRDNLIEQSRVIQERLKKAQTDKPLPSAELNEEIKRLGEIQNELDGKKSATDEDNVSRGLEAAKQTKLSYDEVLKMKRGKKRDELTLKHWESKGYDFEGLSKHDRRELANELRIGHAWETGKGSVMWKPDRGTLKVFKQTREDLTIKNTTEKNVVTPPKTKLNINKDKPLERFNDPLLKDNYVA